MCGRLTNTGFKSKDVIKDARFTNFDELKNIKSDVVCEYCTACMKDARLRRSCFIADEEQIIFLKRNDIEKYIFDLKEKIKGSFVICVTDSFKKHTSFKAPVNVNPIKFFVQDENINYIFDSVKMKKIYEILNEMYLYFSKDELLSGNYEIFFILEYINAYSEERFLQNEEKLSAVRGGKAFELCVNILNSERKNKFIKEKKAQCKTKK